MTLTTVGPRWADAASFSIGWSGHRCSACAVISRGAGTCRQGQTCRGSWTQQHLNSSTWKWNSIQLIVNENPTAHLHVCFSRFKFASQKSVLFYCGRHPGKSNQAQINRNSLWPSSTHLCARALIELGTRCSSSTRYNFVWLLVFTHICRCSCQQRVSVQKSKLFL